jgi:membrane-associated phospholipid phosphatase
VVRSERPLFARAPLFGLALAAAGGLLFAILALNVRRQGRLSQWDQTTCQDLHKRAICCSPPGLAVFRFSASLGHEVAFIGSILLGIYLFFNRRWRHLAMLCVGVFGGNTWFVVLSRFFNRPRPAFSDPLNTIPGPGFPSGHTMTGVTLYGLIFYLLLPRLRSWRWRVLAAMNTGLIVLLIGYSRVFLGAHYPSDVLAGYAFGLFWGALTYTAIDVIGAR